METFVKKYFWVLNLLALSVAAYFVATAANDYLAIHVLSGGPQKLRLPTGPGENSAAMGKQNPAYAETLKARRPFNADPLVQAVAEGTKEVAVEEKGDPTNTGDLPESDLDVQLVGTMVVDPSEFSMATLKASGVSQLVRVGSDLDGKATVAQISRRYIVVNEAGDLKVITLWSEKKLAHKGRRPAVAGREPLSRRKGGERRPKKDYSKGVTKLSDTEYQLSRAMLDEQLQDLSQLGMEARIVPNYRNGKYEGFKLVGVRPNSLYRAMGIRSGDIVKRINGHDINSPNKAIELFEQFKTANSIDLIIERRGQIKTFTYGIK